MKVKTYWRSDNPCYTKTVEVADDTDMEELKQYAINDSKNGYHFHKFVILEE